MRRGNSYLGAYVSRSNMITAFELPSEGHMEEMQSERQEGF